MPGDIWGIGLHINGTCIGGGGYYQVMENVKRGDEGETARRPVRQSVSQPGLETGLGLDLHAPARDPQPHPGE